MKSDYIDTSNPHRLRAFFLFCDCANKAELAKTTIPITITDQRIRRCLTQSLEGERQKAVAAVLELFDPFMPSRNAV